MKLSNGLAIESNGSAPISKVTVSQAAATKSNLRKLKIGIWVYFFLWLTEGALRKWVFPGLATPLLIIRDPVAIWLLYIAWKNNTFPSNKYVITLIVITFISIVTAVLIGHGSLLVALYGARLYIIHFPLVFIIGDVFNRNDVIKLGKIILILAIPVSILVYFQFNSPQTAFVNKGVGDSAEGAGFQGALGYFRPPGLFSFETGNTQYFSFVAIFVLYFLMNQTQIKRYLLFAATISLIIAIPLSISRTLVVEVAICALFLVVSIVRKPEYMIRMLAAMFILSLAMLFLSKTPFIDTPIKALTTRFEQAEDSEGGVGNTAKRLLADLQVPFETEEFPFFGYGLGMGTNAGAKLLVGKSDQFLVAEGEWGRVIGEIGIIMGGLILIVRIMIGYRMLIESYKKLLVDDLLSWMLISVACQNFAQAQWAQPATLGFSVLVMGVCIAALNNPDSEVEPRETIDAYHEDLQFVS